MLNKVVLMGRITRDLEPKQTPQGVSVVTFTIAVDRSFVKQGEERQADFITCVAWRQTADFICRFFGKGRMIAIVGNLRTRNYEDKNGTKHYVTEVYVDEASFTGEPKQQGGYAQQSYNNNNNYGGGYQQGGYQQGGSYNNQPPQQPAQNSYQNQQQNDDMNIGKFQDFEVYNDDGIPF